MASRRQVRWLEGELRALAERGVVDPALPARVGAHYAGEERGRSGVPIFAVLGAALIGLGLILLFGHNWEALSRPARAGVCFALLLTAQGLALHALWQRASSVAWTEGSALFLCFGVAAALALLQQTYQVQGDLRDFLLRWTLLILPVVYALDSRASVSLALGLAAAWLLQGLKQPASPLPFWGLVAGVAPYLWWLRGRTEGRFRNGLVGWVGIPVLLAGATLASGFEGGFAVALLLALVLAGLHAQGTLAAEEAEAQTQRESFAAGPARWLGALGIGAGVLLLCYGDAWQLVGEKIGRAGGPARALPGVALGVASGGLALRGAVRFVRSGEWPRALAAGFPLAFALAHGLGLAAGSRVAAALAMSLYGLGLGCGTVLGGVREGAVGRANAGMLLLAGVISARFLDSEWSFTVRGLVFIALGVAFLALNLVLRRRREGAA